MHQLWCAEFAAAYDPKAQAYWQPHYDEIYASAMKMTHSVKSWHKTIEGVPKHQVLELLRLHHIMPAPDTPAELLAELTFDIPNKANVPDPASWRDFMAFVKTYELCMCLYKRKEWPRVAGDEAEKNHPAFAKCLRGKFMMPPNEHHGKLWVSGHFPYILYADSLPMKAKDATRIPYDKRNMTSTQSLYDDYEHNELTHALIKGSNLGAPLNWTIATARREFWDPENEMHVYADTAAKAEATKSDCKPRGTFSANGEFRHLQAEFDRNCQVVNDIIGCGSLRADVAQHAKGLSNVSQGTRLGRMTTSHDIEAWSPSQDRGHFIEFGMYRAGMFMGVSPAGWAAKWRAFDISINKPGVHKTETQTNGGYQGFPGTLDTSLHVLILTHFLWKMRLTGKIPSDVVTLAKATIDDCLAQMGTWMGTEIDLEMALRDHYWGLGYKIDTVKSVISTCKAIYLNQASIRGGQVAQGLKVICKTDRPLEVVMSTPFEDFMACTSGAKAAIAVGHDPISAYYSASLLGVWYLLRAAPRIADLSVDEFQVAAALPRGDGGLGLTHLPDLVCKEHPDQRSHANHILYVLARCKKMLNTKLSDRALHLWASRKSVPWALVHKHSIFFNPRSCTRAGIPQIENVRRSLIIQSARDWATAEPYATVLASSRSRTIMDLYGMFLTHDVGGIDASFLEAYSSHLPESIIDSLVGKVTSYRVAKEICGTQEVIIAQITIRSMFRTLIEDIVTCPKDSKYDAADLFLDMQMVTGYKRSQQEREEFYAFNDVRINAHTVPSPFECIAVVDALSTTEGTTHIASDVGTLLEWADDGPRCARSLVSKQGVAWPFKSQNWVAESADTFRLMDGVTNKFVEGCCILNWAEQAGMKTGQWEEVFFARWVGDMSLRASMFTTKALQGSIKRSSAAFGDRYHPVFAHPNLQRSVMVSVTPILDLLSKGNYDIDPMSIIATCYAIGAVNMAFIIDQFGKIGQDPPSFAWRVGLHTDLYEESKHLEIEVTIPSEFLADLWELELDGLDFLSNDGGVASQLRAFIEPGGVVALLGHTHAVEDDGALPGTIDIAPMITGPSAAPLGAHFLVMAPAQRVAGTLVSDKLSSTRVERILEISPDSAKLCAVAAIQDHKLTTHAINARLMGDTDAVTDEELAAECSDIAGDTVAIIRANVPTEHPLYQAAAALRACGLVSVRWDDVTNMSVPQFQAEVRRCIMSHPLEALNCLHSHGRDILLSTSGSYESRPHRVRASRDPDKSNKHARVTNLRDKFRARAKEYEQRIKYLKDGKSTIARDSKARNQKRKIVYLVAARTFMQCVEFIEGPELDIGVTMSRVLGRINAKLKSVGAPEKITEAVMLFPNGRVNRDAVERANEREGAKGWYPDEYARGILAAERWAHEDCDFEKKIVYFTPRSVEVKMRVRKHAATVVQHEYVRQAKAPEVIETPEEKVQAPAPVVVAPPPPVVDTPSEPAKNSIASLASLFKRSRKKPEEYKPFISTLDIWQIVLLYLHAGEDTPLEGDADDNIRIAMQGTRLHRADISAKATKALEDQLAIVMARGQMSMIAPVAEDMEVSMDLVE